MELFLKTYRSESNEPQKRTFGKRYRNQLPLSSLKINWWGIPIRCINYKTLKTLL